MRIATLVVLLPFLLIGCGETSSSGQNAGTPDESAGPPARMRVEYYEISKK